MKKYFIIPAVIIIACAGIFIVNKSLFQTKPFQNLPVSEITKASVELLPPNVTLELKDDELEELITILQKVEIYDKDNSYREYSGQAVIFTITKVDGTETTINAYNPFLVIDGVGYQTKYEPCEELNALGNKILERNS